jgi:RNA-directed DNA polymerase
VTTAAIRLQDLQRRIYAKAEAEPSWRFWGLYVHVSKLDTLGAAYAAAKANNGAPGIDGVTVDAIEASGVEAFLQPLRDALVSRTYRPLRCRRKAIPIENGRKVRILSIPAIRDRVVQGALKLVLELIFEYPTRFPPATSGGLGLPSIRQRLEFLGGRLDITSAPGQGSRFTLQVPLRT